LLSEFEFENFGTTKIFFMQNEFKNFNEFRQQLTESPDLQAKFKDNPAEAINQVKLAAELPNTRVYRMVVMSLAITILFIVIGLLIMGLTDKTATNKDILTIFTAIASTAIGALAGILTPVARQQ
jgi:hypothetical protein